MDHRVKPGGDEGEGAGARGQDAVRINPSAALQRIINEGME
jgi:hypothetical protein